MRSDMRFLVLDQGRVRWRLNTRRSKTRQSKRGKGYRRQWQRHDRSGCPPTREPMSARWGSLRRSAGFGMWLWGGRLLARFLQARVGRPWDDVWAEMCRGFPKHSRVRELVADWGRMHGLTLEERDGPPPHSVRVGGNVLWVDPRTRRLCSRRAQ